MIECNEKYFEVLDSIKKTLVVTRNKIVANANKDLVLSYYNIGLKLIENDKWGSAFIDTLAKDLKITFPNLKGMSARNLRYMKKFAKEFDNDDFLQGVLAKISWNHNQVLLDKIKDKEIRKWYAKETLENGWSVSILSHQISLKLYERQALLENKITKLCRIQLMNKRRNY